MNRFSIWTNVNFSIKLSVFSILRMYWVMIKLNFSMKRIPFYSRFNEKTSEGSLHYRKLIMFDAMTCKRNVSRIENLCEIIDNLLCTYNMSFAKFTFCKIYFLQECAWIILLLTYEVDTSYLQEGNDVDTLLRRYTIKSKFHFLASVKPQLSIKNSLFFLVSFARPKFIGECHKFL